MYPAPNILRKKWEIFPLNMTEFDHFHQISFRNLKISL